MALTTPSVPSPLPGKATGSALTFYDWMRDPSLSKAAKVVMTLLRPDLETHGEACVYLAELASAIGEHRRSVTRAIVELEKREIIFSRRGGRGIPKTFTAGAALVAHISDQAVHISRGANVRLRYYDSPQKRAPMSYQTTLDSPPTHSPHDRVIYNSSSTPRAREAPVSSSLLKKLTDRGVCEKTARTLATDFPPDRIERWLFALPYALDAKKLTPRPIRDPAAFLIAAISGDWPIPLPAKRQLERAESQMPAEPEPPVDPQEQKARIEAFFSRLDPETRDELEFRGERYARKLFGGRATKENVETLMRAEIIRHAKESGVAL